MALKEQNVKPLKVDQVCLVVKDLKKSVSQMESLMNIGPFEFKETDRPDAILRGKKTHARAKRAYAQSGKMEMELIEPGQGDNAFREFLHNKGEGVHHLGILVSDMEAELARFKEQGVTVLQSWESARTRIAYLDTEGLLGVILELRQRK